MLVWDRNQDSGGGTLGEGSFVGVCPGQTVAACVAPPVCLPNVARPQRLGPLTSPFVTHFVEK